jgi:hypothetical protein
MPSSSFHAAYRENSAMLENWPQWPIPRTNELSPPHALPPTPKKVVRVLGTAFEVDRGLRRLEITVLDLAQLFFGPWWTSSNMIPPRPLGGHPKKSAAGFGYGPAAAEVALRDL